MKAAIFTDDQLKPGIRFKGNVNGAICEVMKIENSVTFCKGVVVTLKDCKTGHVFQYGLEALKRCDIMILE